MIANLDLISVYLSGNLDKVWPDVRDSAWIGGDREGWERVPYWLDGFILLAYLLEDEDMITRAKRYIDAILAQQCEDGWICPCSAEARPTYDSWAVQLITIRTTVQKIAWGYEDGYLSCILHSYEPFISWIRTNVKKNRCNRNHLLSKKAYPQVSLF